MLHAFLQLFLCIMHRKQGQVRFERKPPAKKSSKKAGQSAFLARFFFFFFSFFFLLFFWLLRWVGVFGYTSGLCDDFQASDGSLILCS